MSPEDLQEKYNGNLNSEMTGPLHNLIAKVKTVLASQGKLPITPDYEYLSATAVSRH